jgi:ParB family transcriptional regulator, chromosome partitioning protein
MLKRIPLEQVAPNPDQPRKLFEQGKLMELAASIRNNGLLQPITVRPMPEGVYQIVAGERRWRAHVLLKEQGQLPEGSILCHVRRMDDEQRDIEAIVENLARSDVTPMEEARAFKRLLDTGMTEEELAAKLGIQQIWRIRDRVRLLNLAPEFIKMFEGGHLTAEAVYEISRLERHADQTKVVQMIARGQLTGYKAVKAAVGAILDGLTQVDIFGSSEAPKVTEAEVEVVNRMEQRIIRIADMVGSAWKDGECIIARKVSPDRARLMADKLRAMRSAVLTMENELRTAAAQGELIAA